MAVGYFDIEANGLVDDATTTHCLALAIDDGEVQLYVGDEISTGLSLLQQCEVIVAHNGIGYDLPVLFRTKGWKAKPAIFDTFVVACLMWPDKPDGNGLASWGRTLGFPKDDFQDRAIERYLRDNPGETKDVARRAIWTRYTDEMGTYCKLDIPPMRALYVHIQEEMTKWAWERPIWIEQEFAKEFALQGRHGVYVDQAKCLAHIAFLDGEMNRIAAEVEPLLPARKATKAELGEFTPPKIQFTKSGKPGANCLKFFDQITVRSELMEAGGDVYVGMKFGTWHRLPTPSVDLVNMSGAPDFERLPLKTTVPMTMSDQQALKLWLLDHGWVPTWWNYKKAPDKRGKLRIVRGDDGNPVPTYPKLHDKGALCPDLQRLIRDNVVSGLVAQAVKWVVYRHRRGLLNSVVEHIRPDGRVRADGITCGTPTGRVTHSVIANFPKADADVMFGHECREILCVPPGRIQAGIDASGLELRMLAHYVGSPTFNDVIVHGKKEDGTEIHTLLLNACKPLVPNRSIQKGVTFCWLYGGSDKKLAQTAGHPSAGADKIGAQIRERMIKAIPGLDDLMAACDVAGKRGWLKGIDGRRIEVRSKHAVLNTLLQSAGSICVKLATIYMMRQIRTQRLDAAMIIHYHDEVQLEGSSEHIAQAAQYFIDGLRYAAQELKLTCPLDGEVKLGNNWADTH